MKFGKEILAATLALVGNHTEAKGELSQKDSPVSEKNKIDIGVITNNKDNSKNYLAFVGKPASNEENIETKNISETRSNIKESDARDAEVSLEANTRFTQLDLTSFFETDMAVIPEASKDKIASSFRDLLSQVTQENRNDYLLADWNVLVFSDPRKTNKWPGGNKELSLERGKQLVAFLQAILQSYDFKGLTPRIKQTMHDKMINIIMPNTGEEEGVMYPTSLKNPKTETEYTEAEIQKIEKENPSLYKELLSFCRGVYFMVNLDNTDDVDIIKPRKPSFPFTPGVPSIKETPPSRTPINPIPPKVPRISKPTHYHYWPSWMTNIVQGRGLAKNNKHFKCHFGGK